MDAAALAVGGYLIKNIITIGISAGSYTTLKGLKTGRDLYYRKKNFNKLYKLLFNDSTKEQWKILYEEMADVVCHKKLYKIKHELKNFQKSLKFLKFDELDLDINDIRDFFSDVKDDKKRNDFFSKIKLFEKLFDLLFSSIRHIADEDIKHEAFKIIYKFFFSYSLRDIKELLQYLETNNKIILTAYLGNDCLNKLNTTLPEHKWKYDILKITNKILNFDNSRSNSMELSIEIKDTKLTSLEEYRKTLKRY